MKSSTIPIRVTEVASWYVTRACFETYDLDGAQHLIKGLVASGAYHQAGVFTRTLISAPILFAECAITLMETLCEYRYHCMAREYLPWFEKRIRSKKHNIKPCDLYIAIAEFSDREIDQLRATQEILTEPSLDQRALRLIRVIEWIKDPNEHIQWVRNRIRSNMEHDPKAAYIVAYALVGITGREEDFVRLCEITRSLVHHVQGDEYQLYLNRLHDLAQGLSRTIIQRTVKRGWSPAMTQQLEQALCSTEYKPEGVLIQ